MDAPTDATVGNTHNTIVTVDSKRESAQSTFSTADTIVDSSGFNRKRESAQSTTSKAGTLVDAPGATLTTIQSVDGDYDEDIESSKQGPPSPPQPQYSALRKFALLVVFCLAQFLDVFNNSALFSAIPIMASDLSMTTSESVWIISATQLAFSAFLLLVSLLR
jgi:hypothetical protein